MKRIALFLLTNLAVLQAQNAPVMARPILPA